MSHTTATIATETLGNFPIGSTEQLAIKKPSASSTRGIAASVEKFESGTIGLSPEKARLMIIDDEPINVRIIEKALRQAGYRQIIGHTDSETAHPDYSTPTAPTTTS